MPVTKVIAFANNKGGSGKSTTCSNVGYCLASLGKKVLLIDGDMQMNLTLSFFSEDEALEYAKGGNNLYIAVKEQKDISDFIAKTNYENLDIVPSSTRMSSIEVDLFTKWQREFILRRGLENVKKSVKKMAVESDTVDGIEKNNSEKTKKQTSNTVATTTTTVDDAVDSDNKVISFTK